MPRVRVRVRGTLRDGAARPGGLLLLGVLGVSRLRGLVRADLAAGRPVIVRVVTVTRVIAVAAVVPVVPVVVSPVIVASVVVPRHGAPGLKGGGRRALRRCGDATTSGSR
jgi:hypothetical protein